MRAHGLAELVARGRGRAVPDAVHGRDRDRRADRIAVAFARAAARRRARRAGRRDARRSPRRSAAVGLDDRDRRLLGRPGDARDAAPRTSPRYDRAFAVVLDRRGTGAPVADAPVRRSCSRSTLAVRRRRRADADERRAGADVPVLTVRWSPAEMLRHRDFAAYTAGRVRRGPPAHGRPAPRRRAAPSRRRRQRVAARGAARSAPHGAARRCAPAASRCGARFRAPAHAPAPARAALRRQRLDGAVRPRASSASCTPRSSAGRRVEAFALGTRLTRVTRELSSRDPDAALAAAARRVVDWSGGTRLGEGLRAFNDAWGMRGMARGAVVVILSDGWDRGDPEVLGRADGPPGTGSRTGSCGSTR